MSEHKILPVSGPQHTTIFEELIGTYKELYNVIKLNFENEKFSRFFPLCGVRYNEELQISKEGLDTKLDFVSDEDFIEKHTEPAVRLMLVGRSVNGWKELDERTEEEFSESAREAILGNGFDWLQNDGKGKETYIKVSEQEESQSKECRYNVNKSSFFRCTRKILGQLKPITVMDQRWFDHIVWSNLYTIAPPHTGNAEGQLQDAQLELSKKLLQQQIEYYKPTHILFITDWDWWFDRFTDVFPNVNKVGNTVTDNVVGKGMYNNARVVVTVRPDRTRPNRPNEERFVEEVVQNFGYGEKK